MGACPLPCAPSLGLSPLGGSDCPNAPNDGVGKGWEASSSKQHTDMGSSALRAVCEHPVAFGASDVQTKGSSSMLL